MSDPAEEQGGKAAPADKTTTTDLPPEALKERLTRERQAGAKDAERALLERLGMSPEDATAKLAKLTEIENASKSELQRLQEERDALKPRAARLEAAEKRIAELSETEYGALSDEDKAFVDGLSTNGDAVDHDARLRVITHMKRTGKIAGATKADPKLPKGSSTSAAEPPPKTVTEPEKDSPDFHFKRWKAFPEGSVLQSAYFNDNAGAIRQSAAFKAANQ